MTLQCLHGTLCLRTVKTLCSNLQKPPLPSKIFAFTAVVMASL